jgi:hypothetical protein
MDMGPLFNKAEANAPKNPPPQSPAAKEPAAAPQQ